MDNISFAERLTKLRMAKNVSAREMSFAIGLSANYINKIENKKTLPSMMTFFYICEYLNISQQEFFDENNENPEQLKQLVADLKKLDEKALTHITGIVKIILEKNL